MEYSADVVKNYSHYIVYLYKDSIEVEDVKDDFKLYVFDNLDKKYFDRPRLILEEKFGLEKEVK